MHEQIALGRYYIGISHDVRCVPFYVCNMCVMPTHNSMQKTPHASLHTAAADARQVLCKLHPMCV